MFMFKVQLRDSANPGTVITNLRLPYQPFDHAEIRVRRRAGDTKHTSYRIVGRIYEAVELDPAESGVVLLVTPIAG